MNLFNRIGVGTLTVLVAAIGLSGCVSGDGALPTPRESSHDVGQTRPPSTPDAAKIPGDVDGDGKLSGWEKEQLVAASYTTASGEIVPLPADGPLPAPVIADIQASSGGTIVASGQAPSNAEDAGAKGQAFLDTVAAIEAKIGRKVVTVAYVYDGNSGGNAWCVGGMEAAGVGCFGDQQSAIDAANAWVGGRTSVYAVIPF
ncbi:hypothetical protein [Herbiconiux sp. UC225_62]|uniref:hypothetical protein n=1 Tax=Herbiconiux sp. UC225_62 TaxID=3350168 RepID=UPI0036D2C93E